MFKVRVGDIFLAIHCSGDLVLPSFHEVVEVDEKDNSKFTTCRLRSNIVTTVADYAGYCEPSQNYEDDGALFKRDLLEVRGRPAFQVTTHAVAVLWNNLPTYYRKG